MSPTRPLHALLAVFERATCAELSAHLQAGGWVCGTAETPRRAETLLQERTPDLVMIGMGGDGHRSLPLELIRKSAPDASVVAVAAPDPDLYFAAARAGVEVVLSLPLERREYAPKLDALVARLLERLAHASSMTESAAKLSGPNSAATDPDALVAGVFAASEDMAEVRELIEKVAPTSATVLLRGESGVGKELAAQLIHHQSLRSRKPFVKVNCAAIPNELLESELFGYEAGAFTGAAAKGKPGKFEQADGGTIFLDEIGELHPMLQAKLLHVLQDGEFTRLGAKRDTSVDVRVICATNKPLDALVASGEFREDLYYRINVIAVHLPPLRARTSEIPGLMDFFLRRYSNQYSKPLLPLQADAMGRLMEYDWPGNIRELENLCKQYVIVGGMEKILRGLEHRKQQRQLSLAEPTAVERLLKVTSETITDTPTLLEIGRQAAWAAERTAIQKALQETHWNRREASRRLGVSYKALLNKIGQMAQDLESQVKVAK